MSVDMFTAVMSLRPGVELVMTGEDIEHIVYYTPGVVPVTRAEVDAEIIKLQAVAAAKEIADAAAREAALVHARSLGFTDEMIAVMYPGLVEAVIPPGEPAPTADDYTTQPEPVIEAP